jgi:cardiolipin synthase
MPETRPILPPPERPFLNIPNLITLARILLTPLFVFSLVNGRRGTAFAVLVAAGITDLMDGFAARQLKQRTRIGFWLDPAADKLMITTAFVALTVPALAAPLTLPLWLTAVVIGRDIIIAIGAGIITLVRGPRIFPPSIAGKICTVFQVLTVWATTFELAWGGAAAWLPALYLLTAALTCLSGALYAWRGIRMLGERDAAPREAADVIDPAE